MNTVQASRLRLITCPAVCYWAPNNRQTNWLQGNLIWMNGAGPYLPAPLLPNKEASPFLPGVLCFSVGLSLASVFTEASSASVFTAVGSAFTCACPLPLPCATVSGDFRFLPEPLPVCCWGDICAATALRSLLRSFWLTTIHCGAVQAKLWTMQYYSDIWREILLWHNVR